MRGAMTRLRSGSSSSGGGVGGGGGGRASPPPVQPAPEDVLGGVRVVEPPVEEATEFVTGVFEQPGGLGLGLASKAARDPPIVTELHAGGQAARAGKLCPGLVLFAVNGQPIAGLEFDQTLHLIKVTPRPLALTFAVPPAGQAAPALLPLPRPAAPATGAAATTTTSPPPPLPTRASPSSRLQDELAAAAAAVGSEDLGNSTLLEEERGRRGAGPSARSSDSVGGRSPTAGGGGGGLGRQAGGEDGGGGGLGRQAGGEDGSGAGAGTGSSVGATIAALAATDAQRVADDYHRYSHAGGGLDGGDGADVIAVGASSTETLPDVRLRAGSQSEGGAGAPGGLGSHHHVNLAQHDMAVFRAKIEGAAKVIAPMVTRSEQARLALVRSGAVAHARHGSIVCFAVHLGHGEVGVAWQPRDSCGRPSLCVPAS
jgi:hypothetical protein